jgi:hypothetical protein
MSDQEEARIAASRHFDDLYSRWLVHPSPGNRFLNDRYGSNPAVHGAGTKRVFYPLASANPVSVSNFFAYVAHEIMLRLVGGLLQRFRTACAEKTFGGVAMAATFQGLTEYPATLAVDHDRGRHGDIGHDIRRPESGHHPQRRLKALAHPQRQPSHSARRRRGKWE